MQIRIMETETHRVRSIARAYGVYREGLSMRELTDEIAKAHRREVEAEDRRLTRERHFRMVRECVAVGRAGHG